MKGPVDILGNPLGKGDFVAVDVSAKKLFGTIVEVQEGGILAPNLTDINPAAGHPRVIPGTLKIVIEFNLMFAPGTSLPEILRCLKPATPPKGVS